MRDYEDLRPRRPPLPDGRGRRPATTLHYPLFSSCEIHEHWIDHVSWLGPASSALITRASILTPQSKHRFGVFVERPAEPGGGFLSDVSIWQPNVLDGVFGTMSAHDAVQEPHSAALPSIPRIDLGENNLAYEELWRGRIKRSSFGSHDVGWRRDMCVAVLSDQSMIEIGCHNISSVADTASFKVRLKLVDGTWEEFSGFSSGDHDHRLEVSDYDAATVTSDGAKLVVAESKAVKVYRRIRRR